MKFLNLHLRKFGSFTDRNLVFETDTKNLQLIYGPNEAGKSTILRAINGLLFEIPARTNDDHLHSKNDLRIGATLLGKHGTRMELIRKKGRTGNTLLDPDGNSIDDNQLRGWLGGVHRGLFSTMFGLTHFDLVEGGSDLLAGKGELGESLFAAGTGIRSLHNMRRALRQQASDIFKPTGKNPTLNLALSRLKHAKAKVHEATLRPKDFADIDRDQQLAETELRSMQQQQTHMGKKLFQMQRLQRLHPTLRQRGQLHAQLESLGSMKVLPEGAREKRIEAQRQLSQSQSLRSKLLDRQQQLRDRLEQFADPSAILRLSTPIRQLQQTLGANLKAKSDRKDLLARLDALTLTMEQHFVAIGKEMPSIEDALGRFDRRVHAKIRQLSDSRVKMEAEYERAQQRVHQEIAKKNELLETRNELLETQDPGNLKRWLAQAGKFGELDVQLLQIETEIHELSGEAKGRLESLPLWNGELMELPSLQLPDIHCIERFRQQYEELATAGQELKRRQQEDQDKRMQCEQRLSELMRPGQVPNQAKLEDIRLHRNEVFHAISQAWSDAEGKELPQPKEAMLESLSTLIQEADQFADDLISNATRVAEHELLLQQLDHCDQALRSYRIRVTENIAQQSMMDERWAEQWRSAKITPLHPVQMRSWLSDYNTLTDLARGISKLQHRYQVLLEARNRLRSECDHLLQEFGEAKQDSRESLGMLLHRAQELVRRFESQANRLEHVDEDLKRCLRNLQQAEDDQNSCIAQRNAWFSSLTSAIEATGLGLELDWDSISTVLAALDGIFESIERHRELKLRIEHIDQDAILFERQVQSLAVELSLENTDSPAEQLAPQLLQILEGAEKNQNECQHLQQQLEELTQQISELKLDSDQAQSNLAHLMTAANCESLDALEQAELDSAQYRSLQIKVQEIESQLMSEGVDLSELLQQERSTDFETLPSEIHQLELELRDLRKEIDNTFERIGETKQKLRTMDGSASAAIAASEAESTLAEIRELVNEYVTTSLSAKLLDEQIIRYREDHQGPILQRASEIFKQLTLNSFTRLTTDLDDRDEVVILCCRSNEEQVPVYGLSDGTRDQLYLALRLASLERYNAVNEPLPLILDDILVNFDDQRSVATLQVLTTLDLTTQVLFFTHHEHVLGLAEQFLRPNSFQCHRLDRRGPPRNFSQ